LEIDVLTLFLTQSELFDLTERRRKAEQIAWLTINEFPFAIGANGHARVSREYLLARLGGVLIIASQAIPEPNWGAI
jgi:Domain of unknown function (DUF4224)